jgi:glutamyl-tRNA synthetase
MTVVTRFAPSPTGYLHIGGARTALFNWLFARHHGGTMLLRIEDTDRARSTDEAVEAIYDGLRWLGLEWDGDAISQFARRERHQEVVEQLLRDGNAYRCYCSAEELDEMRTKARAEGRTRLYDGRCRHRAPDDVPADIQPVIRLKVPLDGETEIADRVQGTVRVRNTDLDDMVLLRGDGTPTYMLAVVVDDRDMGVTHIIRGDDHLTNAMRQRQIYDLLGWEAPVFAHIPLIHGPDGAKLSKRHGALAVQAYRDMGYLPEAVCNYLLRLGWSHGDDEIISREQAIEWFGLENVGKSAARFDFDKLENLNGQYIRDADDTRLLGLVVPVLGATLGRTLTGAEEERLRLSMHELKNRAKTILQLADIAMYCVAERPLKMDDKAASALDDEARAIMARLADSLSAAGDWQQAQIEAAVRGFAERENLKFGKVAQPLRAALTGQSTSPGIFNVLYALGRDEAIGRIADAAENR